MNDHSKAKIFLIKSLIFVVLFIILLIVGIGIGFVLGGGSFFQTFSWNTWQHLLDYFKN